MIDYAHNAIDRGIQVIIAGAGGSAHLQGMSASEVRLPVLGVAVEGTPDPMSSAFGSMLRMPEGIPLATMGKGPAGAANAALEAIRIIALRDTALASRYDEYVDELAAAVLKKDARVREIGPEAYLEEMIARENA
jgi:phosphoribosylaminoimidazole carboxylase PurE protein